MKLFPHVEPRSKQERIVFAAGIIILIAMALIDQLTKELVVRNIAYGERIAIIPDFFNLTYVRNPGAAWGIFAGRGWMLLTISLTVFVIMTIFIRRICEGWSERYYAVMLIMSGIIGNCFDRVFRGGAVVDFLDFKFGSYHYPSFNIADSCICVGVGIFILSSIIRPEKRKDSSDEKAASV